VHGAMQHALPAGPAYAAAVGGAGHGGRTSGPPQKADPRLRCGELAVGVKGGLTLGKKTI